MTKEKRTEIKEFLKVVGLKGTFDGDKNTCGEHITFVYKTRAHLTGDWKRQIMSALVDLETLVQNNAGGFRKAIS